MAQHPHVQSADGYVADVLSGAVPAGKWIKLAAKRHQRDVKASKSKDWPYRLDADRAERVCKFVELMPHVKGRWAAGTAQLLRLEPWQCFALVSMFGWVHKFTGLRRFRKARLYLSRKNGKSTLASPIGLYMLAADNEPGAEVYSGATSEKQAWEVFGPAKEMAKRTPALLSKFGITVNAKSLIRLGDMSKFEPVIGKPGDGSSPHCSITDEYHEHQTDDQLATMETGMGARDQPMSLVISTAGDNLAGPCREDWLDLQKVLERVVEDDRTFGLIYAADVEPYDDILQSLSAFRRLDDDCTCNSVPFTLSAKLLAEECAVIATRSGGELEGLVNALTTLIETQERDSCAGLATNSTCSTATRNEKPSQSKSAGNGLKGTATEPKPQTKSGEKSRGQSTSCEQTLGASVTGSATRNTGLFTKGSRASAGYAESNSKFSAWITATTQELFGGFYAENAILQSVFSATLRRVFSAHSNTCGIRAHRLVSKGLVVTHPPDDWTSDVALRKANPNYDVSVSGEFLQAQLREAINNPRKQGHFKTKHLNMWVQARDAFINMQRWHECKGELTLADMRGKPCWMGLDLASKVDIAALELLFEVESGRYARFGKYYLPEETVNQPENQHYRKWRDTGLLTVTDGNIIDFGVIRDDIVQLSSDYGVNAVGYDPHQATMLVTQLQDEGVPVIEFRPTVLNFSEPMKQVDALIRDRKLAHDGDEVMTWCMSNVVAKIDAKDNVYPRKERDANKIDPFVALCMAMGLAMKANPDDSAAFADFLSNPIGIR